MTHAIVYTNDDPTRLSSKVEADITDPWIGVILFDSPEVFSLWMACPRNKERVIRVVTAASLRPEPV